eukprot:7663262-Alexandrium_andersonii.AAC.1
MCQEHSVSAESQAPIKAVVASEGHSPLMGPCGGNSTRPTGGVAAFVARGVRCDNRACKWPQVRDYIDQ